MDLSVELENLIGEYLSEHDKQNIQHISITIPSHKGYFFILDSIKLSLKQSDVFSLSILFSYNSKTRKAQLLANQIIESHCFNTFTAKGDNGKVTYIKDFGAAKQAIVESVEYIIKSLFPNVDGNSIKIELKRFAGWYTIQE